MLLELRVENLLLIDRAELRLGDGLNAVTGETGAGKTMLAHALDLLLGGKPRPGIVRPGAAEAYVEGVFAPPPGLLDDPALAELRERLPEDDSEIVLARRVSAEGRSRAYVQGRSATAADLSELGGRLVAFYGQHEHRAAGGGAEAIAPEGGEPGVALMLADAERLSEAVAGADPELDAFAARMRELRIEAEDLGAELRRYESVLDGDPERLQEVEERLDIYDRLERKHGGTVAAVLEHAERCRAELALLVDTGAALETVERELAEARADADSRAAALGTARRKAAPKLAKAVLRVRTDLAMGVSSLEVRIEPRESRTRSGDERVEFLISPNAGVAPQPLRETASGGESSRVMLALMTVASGGGGGRTLVFDEVDAGIGGQTARVVGEKLRALAAGGQVLCITHLPQIASLAERHFSIEKEQSGELARAQVAQLDGEAVVEELCRMLGADTGDKGARRHAEELLAAA